MSLPTARTIETKIANPVAIHRVITNNKNPIAIGLEEKGNSKVRVKKTNRSGHSKIITRSSLKKT